MEKICGIYKVTSPSGRIYIGQSRNVLHRFISYKKLNKANNLQTKLFRSFTKYGVENHTFEIIEQCPLELLNKRERYWQDFYNVIKSGLNCILVATDILPVVLSEETRQKYVKRSSGENNSFYGKHHTEESRKLQSESAKKRVMSEQSIKSKADKISKELKGVSKSKTHVENIRLSKLANKNPLFGVRWKLVDEKRVYFKEKLNEL